MSYRSVKRVLGETRLELKCLLLFAVCLLTLIGGSFWWYGSRTEELVFDKARNMCQNLVDADSVGSITGAKIPTNVNFKDMLKEWAEKLQTQKV